MRKVILRQKKITMPVRRVNAILKQRGEGYGAFKENVARINGLMFAAKSDLRPDIHSVTFVLVCLKMARLLNLIEQNPLAEFKDTDSFFFFCLYIKLICDNYEPRVAGFYISELDDQNTQRVKFIANTLFKNEIFARIDREEEEEEL